LLLLAGPVAAAAPPATDDALAAIKAGDVKQLKQLLGGGLSVNATGGQFGESLLNNAILLGQPKAAAALVEAGADLEASTGIGGGLTPLCRAANVCDLATTKLLLAKGAKINARSGGELSSMPLLQALSESFFTHGDCYEEFHYLLEHGADPNGSKGWFGGEHGQNAVMLATYRFYDSRFMDELLKRKADANSSWSHKTALESAIERLPVEEEKPAREALKVIQLLVRAGAKVDAKSKDGRTMAELVAERFAGARSVAFQRTIEKEVLKALAR
jgi:ankyrin repeat protein